MRRGEIRWYSFESPDKRRPVVLLTRGSAISFLNALTVAPITSTVRGIPSEVVLTPEDDGVLTLCAANFDNIQTLPKHKLGTLITALSSTRLREVDRAIRFALGLEPF